MWIALSCLFIKAAGSLLLPRLEAAVRADFSHVEVPLSLEHHLVMWLVQHHVWFEVKAVGKGKAQILWQIAGSITLNWVDWHWQSWAVMSRAEMFTALLVESENVKPIAFVKIQQGIKRLQRVKGFLKKLNCFYDILLKVTSSVSG